MDSRQKRPFLRCAATMLFILMLSGTVSVASAHGEGGPELRQGTLLIRPASAGGTGYNETQFSLSVGDSIQYSWSIKDPADGSVAFNVHGHVGAEVRIFNRTDGSTGAGSMVAPSQMIVALMWRSSGLVALNVSYAVELRHVPDLYSAVFLTVNLAALMLLFAAVWELSIRGRGKVDQATKEVASGAKNDSSGEETGAPEPLAPSRPSPASSRAGLFSLWKRRAVLYAIVILLCSAPIISYLARPGDVLGSEPQPAPWAAFVAHEGSPNVTIVDPILSVALGEIQLRGPVVALAASPVTRLVYAATRKPSGVEFIDGATFAVLRRIDLPSAPDRNGIGVSEDGRVLAVLVMGNLTLFDARTGTELNRISTSAAELLGVFGTPPRAALWEGFGAILRIYDLDSLKALSNIDTGHSPARGMLSQDWKTFLVWNVIANSDTVSAWDLGEKRQRWNRTANISLPLGSNADGTIGYFASISGVVALSIEDGHEIGRALGARPAILASSRSGILYGVDYHSSNITMIRASDLTLLGSFDAGEPDDLLRTLILDSSGSYALVTAAGSGELITFHDAPGLHYHSRMKVGIGASLCVLLEPPDSG